MLQDPHGQQLEIVCPTNHDHTIFLPEKLSVKLQSRKASGPIPLYRTPQKNIAASRLAYALLFRIPKRGFVGICVHEEPNRTGIAIF